MNELRKYREKHSVSQTDFAKSVGVTQGIISKIERDDIRPGLDLAFKIEKETAGAVPAKTWAQSDEPEGGDA